MARRERKIKMANNNYSNWDPYEYLRDDMMAYADLLDMLYRSEEEYWESIDGLQSELQPVRTYQLTPDMLSDECPWVEIGGAA